jgi:protein O-GlcNAc transferase
MADDERRVVQLGEPWRHHLARGLEALRRDAYADADGHLSRASALAPDEPDVLLARARALCGRREHQRAASLLERVVEARPESRAAAALLARCLGLELDQRERAFGVLHAALERHEDSAELHVLRGELLLEEDAIEAARGAFAQALALEPADPAARAAQAGLARAANAEGIQLSEAGESERAAFAFKRAADLDPQWSAPHVNLGVVFERLSRLPKAMESFRSALLHDPENPVALFDLGSVAHQLGDLEAAVEAFETLLSLAPDYPGLRVALANVLGDRRDFDNAVALLLEELEVDPDSVVAWSSLGLAYACAGNSARGEECLHEALARDPQRLDAYHNLAVIYTTQRRLDAAAAVLERAFAVDPARTRELVSKDANLAPLRELPHVRSLVD